MKSKSVALVDTGRQVIGRRGEKSDMATGQVVASSGVAHSCVSCTCPGTWGSALVLRQPIPNPVVVPLFGNEDVSLELGRGGWVEGAHGD